MPSAVFKYAVKGIPYYTGVSVNW